MHALDAAAIRASFINASRKEVSDLSLPADLSTLAWDKLTYLGWRDPRSPRRAALVVPVGDGLIGVALRQAEASPRTRAQCSLCQDVTLPNDVVFFGAKRTGAAGRKGDTLGTLICTGFECSTNVRKQPVSAYLGFDVEAERQRRIGQLAERAATFARAVAADD